MSHLDDVRTFRRHFGFTLPDKPTCLEPDLALAQYNHICEEAREFFEATARGDRAAALDALVDLEYVLLGTVLLAGYGAEYRRLVLVTDSPDALPKPARVGTGRSVYEEAWRRVHAANMAKERGVGKRGHDYDVVKPDGWVPPRLDDLIQGEEGDNGAVR